MFSSPLSVLLFAVVLAGSALADDRLDKLRNGFDEAFHVQVINKQLTAQADLDAKYLASVQSAQTAAQEAGKTNEAIAFKDERQRIAEKTAMPDSDSEDTPPPLKNMRQKYRAAVAALQTTVDTAALPLVKKYDTALQALETEYTQAGHLDEAKLVQKEREYLQIRNLGSVSLPKEVSKAGLTTRTFVYGAIDPGQKPYVSNSMELAASDKILNYPNSNEVTWRVEDGHLKFFAGNGGLTVTFRDPKWDNGAASFLGDHPPDKRITFLEEVTKLTGLSVTAVEKRLMRNSFLLTPINPANGDRYNLVFKSGGKIQGNAPGMSWEIQSGSFVLNGMQGKPPLVFSDVYTWDEGKNLYLTVSKTKEVQYRLIEVPPALK